MSVPFVSWTVEQVAAWARSIGVNEESAAILTKNDIDGPCLRELTQEDLRDLGLVLVTSVCFSVSVGKKTQEKKKKKKGTKQENHQRKRCDAGIGFCQQWIHFESVRLCFSHRRRRRYKRNENNEKSLFCVSCFLRFGAFKRSGSGPKAWWWSFRRGLVDDVVQDDEGCCQMVERFGNVAF